MSAAPPPPKEKKKEKPKLEEFIEPRDYLGAITLLEVCFCGASTVDSQTLHLV